MNKYGPPIEIMKLIIKLKIRFPEFNIKHIEPQLGLMSPYEDFYTLGYYFSQDDIKYGRFYQLKMDSLEQFDFHFHNIKKDILNIKRVIKYGEDYEKVIKMKWLNRKISRKLPEKGIKHEGVRKI